MVDRNSTISVVPCAASHLTNGKQLDSNAATFARTLVTLVCLVAIGAPAAAATVTAGVTASGVKPLLLTKLQNLDLGSVTLGTGVWSGATVSLSQAGALACANAPVAVNASAHASAQRFLFMFLLFINAAVVAARSKRGLRLVTLSSKKWK